MDMDIVTDIDKATEAITDRGRDVVTDKVGTGTVILTGAGT
jgi:hypothetical protein